MSSIKDTIKIKNIKKKQRIERNALNRIEYNKLVDKKVEKYNAELNTSQDKIDKILVEIDRLSELYFDDRENKDIESSIDALNIIIDKRLYELNDDDELKDVFDREYDFKKDFGMDNYKFIPPRFFLRLCIAI